VKWIGPIQKVIVNDSFFSMWKAFDQDPEISPMPLTRSVVGSHTQTVHMGAFSSDVNVEAQEMGISVQNIFLELFLVDLNRVQWFAACPFLAEL
jgi:hypothetical protein